MYVIVWWPFRIFFL